MFQIEIDQRLEVAEQKNGFPSLPLALGVQPDLKLYNLLTDLSPESPWGDRQRAARKMGDMRSTEAVSGLLAALQVDNFWMVRCAIIQALEKIGDPGAIPTLLEVAKSDSFQVVRSYAAKAIERLSPAL
jgi:HEAT repeat protein